jgi:hypothetical protein
VNVTSYGSRGIVNELEREFNLGDITQTCAQRDQVTPS